MSATEIRAVRVEAVEIRVTLPYDDGYRVLTVAQAASLYKQLGEALNS